MDKEIKIRDASFFARIIAEKECISFEAAQLFIREFFLLIEKGLKEDNYVHIKGLGSFKKICLEIDKGDEQSKNELIFVPDKELQSVINKPFEHFEPVVVSSDVLMEQLLKEQQTEQKKETSEEVLDEVNTENEEQKSLVDESQPIDNNSEEKPDNSEKPEEGRKVEKFFLGIYGADEEDKKIEESMNEIETIEKEEPVIKKEEKEQKPAKDKSKADLIWMFSFVIFILFIFVLLLFFRLLSVQKELDAYINLRTEAKALERIDDSSIVLYPDAQPTEEVMNDTTEEQRLVRNVEEEEKIVQQETPKTSSNSYDIPARESLRYSIVGTQSTHHVVHGETLRILSEVYFGSKGYWPYIYYHNEEIIKDPNNIPKDMVLKIPKLNIKANQ